jgi:20S proteasome alpha/beta subunit
MSLIVSLRIPDGVVLAADSLATTQGLIDIKANVQGECPKCKETVSLGEMRMPPVPVPSSTSSFAEKLFPFCRRYGVAAYGLSSVNQRTIYRHVRDLEKRQKGDQVENVTAAAGLLKAYMQDQLELQVRAAGKEESR